MLEDQARTIRKQLIASTPEPIATPLDIKRRAALAYLGDRHVLHPAYKFNPRHAFSLTEWQPHSVLRPVQIAAQQAGRI